MLNALKILIGWRALGPKQTAEWPLEMKLMDFIGLDARGKSLASIPYTIGQSFEGICMFGRTGSGKTTGSAEHISRAMLSAGYGGLVLCAKAGEADLWKKRCEACGRSGDVVIFGPGSPARINFLDYEIKEGGKNSEGVVGLLAQIGMVIQAPEGGADIWEKSGRGLLRVALELLLLAGVEITAGNILSACTDDIAIAEFRVMAAALQKNKAKASDVDAIGLYYDREIIKMSDKTRSSITMTISAMLGNFRLGDMRELFCTKTNTRPTDARNGKIIIVDMPVKTHNDQGILAGAIWKVLFQKAMEREKTSDSTRPVFLFADECQFFTGPEDSDFQTTARAAKCSTVYITQNLPNLKVKYGGDQKGDSKTRGLLGNLVTKIFHANDESETNKYASEAVDKTLQERQSTSRSANFGDGSFSGSGGSHTNLIWDYHLQLSPITQSAPPRVTSKCTTFRT